MSKRRIRTADGTDINDVGGGGSPDWGDIGGLLANQTDLQAALDAKGNASFLYGAITTTTNNTTTYTALTGSDVTVEAGKTYGIRWRLRTYSAATSTGVRTQRVFGGGAAGTVHGMHTWFPSSQTAGYTRASREGTNDPALGTGNNTSSTSAAASIWIDALFECTTGGTLGLEFASEVGSSLVTIDGDGSYWEAVVRLT